jgi:hypothetical protein
LSTFFKMSSFTDGFIKREFSPCDWILISRWMRGTGLPGIIITKLQDVVFAISFSSDCGVKSSVVVLIYCLY